MTKGSSFIDQVFSFEITDTVGVSINDNLLYIPDIDSWEEWPFAHQALGDHKISIVDSTFFNDHGDSLIRSDVKNIPHPSTQDTIKRFKYLLEDGSRKIVLSHINHSNPIVDSSTSEYQFVVDNGFTVASDGDTFPL
jgi:pyrroloquinoline quinone biosynthesis protein B